MATSPAPAIRVSTLFGYEKGALTGASTKGSAGVFIC